ncbi:MAG: phage major capsid protein [Chloroflexi bacterium HGW-Chloroflexi-9]|nr:MAG: phage major capsid protein [Chloroflexi bacterium HGW-Chloroflexi-9]
MATLNIENVRTALAEAEKRAAAAWANADGIRAGMIKEGVDLQEEENFNKISEAFKVYDQAKEEAAQLGSKLGELAAIEQMYRAPGAGGGLPQGATPGGDRARQRLGHRFTSSEQYQRLHRDGVFSGGEAMGVQIIGRGFDRPIEVMSRDEIGALLEAGRFGATTITGGGATSAGPFIQNDLMPGFIAYLRETPRVAQVVGQGTTDSDVVEYVTQSAVTNAAAETAEDTQASEATYAYATNTTNVKEITHFVPITLRAMANAGQLRGVIENELVIDVLDRLDSEVAAGNGSGQNFTGITATSGIGTFALGAYTRLDAIHRAITTVRTAAGVRLESDYIGMHPNDWQKVRLEKDSNGNYLMGPAGMAGDKQVWGVPVIASSVFTEGTIVAGNFNRGATLWLREGLSVNAGLDGNDFTKRRISLLAAMRAAFVAHRPTAFCTVTSF